jgi:hypothetical protein
VASKAETKLRGKIVKAIKDEFDEVHIEHPHGSMYSSGMLDLVGCLDSIYFAFEVKTPQNRKGATDLQQATIDSIIAAGGVAAVIRSEEEALEVLHGI